MARAWNKLSANFVRSVSKRGRYADGGGLYLQTARGGGKAWVFQFQRNGARRAMGLGAARSVPLALARELAAQCREQLARGLDPVDARKAAALEQRAARARLMTFKQCAEEYHAANLTRWSNEKHRTEWLSALRRFAFPVIGHLSVDTIDSGLVHKVLTPLVTEKAVTAARLRGRIEAVLDYAKAAGRRTGDNPAAKDTIAHMLPLKSEKADVQHQPALPFAKLPALMQALRARRGPGGAAAGTDHPDCHAGRRRALRAVRRIRLGRRRLDGAASPHERLWAEISGFRWGRVRSRSSRRCVPGPMASFCSAARGTATAPSVRTKRPSC